MEGCEMKKAIFRDFLIAAPIVFSVLFFAVVWPSESTAVNASEANVRFNGNEEGGDAFGFSVSSAGDFNGDGYEDVIVGQFLDEVAYIFYGQEADPISRIEIDASDADIKFYGPFGSGSWFGHSVACAGDFNGDGYDDVIIGDPKGGYFEGGKGTVYIFFGGDYLAGTKFYDFEADRIIRGEEFGDNFGWAVASAGNFNGDEYDDIVIGAPKLNEVISVDPPVKREGCGYVFCGDDREGPLDIVASEDDRLEGCERNRGDVGFSVAGNVDIDGDGWDDVILGSPNVSGGGIQLYLGSGGPCVEWQLGGEYMGSKFGFAIAGVGDVNDDEYEDIIVGAPGTTVSDGLSELSNAGSAYVILGRSEEAWRSSRSYVFDNNGIITVLGESAGDRFGSAVGGAGYFNTDSFADFIVGAPLGSTPSPLVRPIAYLFRGREASIDSNLTMNASSNYGCIFVGEDYNHRLGGAVSGMFDWNNDDSPDLLLGAPGNGTAYLFLGLSIQISPQSGPGFPVSLMNNTDKLSRGSPFYRKSFDQGTIGFYFMEPGEGQQLQWWGDVPFNATVQPGKSVNLTVPWPVCNQYPSDAQVICNQPSYRANLFWTYHTTIAGQHHIYAFLPDTQEPQQVPPLLPLKSDENGVCNFQLLAFDTFGTSVGRAKVFSVPPAVAAARIEPRVLNRHSNGQMIKCVINLPDRYEERDVDPDSLRLSIPFCSGCGAITAQRGFASKKSYFAFFSRRKLIGLLGNMDLKYPTQLLLRVSGHLKEGAPFEGDAVISVNYPLKKTNNRLPR